jgi:xylulokinase
MPEPLILAIDAGTSALKACLYSQSGTLLASQSQAYGYRMPQPGWAEGDPEAWWSALAAAVAGMRAAGHDLGRVAALGVTGQMHSTVLLDARGEVLAPTILWLDRRAAAETAELVKITGLPPYHLNSTYSLPKLVWLARHRPEIMAQVAALLWPKDYLRYRLTGQMATDATEAAGAALYDFATGAWSTERLALTGLPPSVLPPLRPPESLAGALLPEVADRLGLPQDLQVVTGAGDVIALLGGAPPDPGRLTYSLGSSSMISVLMPPGQEPADPQGRVYIYRLGPHRLLNAVSSTTGAAWSWAVRTLAGDDMGRALELAAAVPPGAEGLVFLPYLAGERSPFWSDGLRGGFVGLGLHHTAGHMLRAVLEGVGFSLRLLLDIYAELGLHPGAISLAGGGARSPLWSRILADTCQLPVAIYAAEETVTRPLYAWCAAFLGNAAQLEPGLTFEDALRRTFAAPARCAPDTGLAAAYAQAYAFYRDTAMFLHGISYAPHL